MGKGMRQFMRGLSYMLGGIMCISIILSPFGIIVIQLAMISEQLEENIKE